MAAMQRLPCSLDYLTNVVSLLFDIGFLGKITLFEGGCLRGAPRPTLSVPYGRERTRGHNFG